MQAYVIKQTDNTPAAVVKALFSTLLENSIDYIFMPGCSPYSKLPMPMLVSDPSRMDALVPLAPAMPFNSARQAASVLKSNTGKQVALFLRPCEKRALVELVKLSQCTLENALIVTSDCTGRVENKTYLELIEKHPELEKGLLDDQQFTSQITPSCSACTRFTDDTSDLHLNHMGCSDAPMLTAHSPKGEKALEALDCDTVELPGTRAAEIEKIQKERSGKLAAMTEKVLAKTGSVETFQEMIGSCLNCYNCRSACPVCYCKECVFLTDIFSHMPETLQNRADKKGMIKLPADTTMFHLTRLAHMSHACVGCGQCSSVCPSDIPVADIFKVISDNTQAFFGYIPGRDEAEKMPYLNYKKEN